ncbi:MAG TPA: T9SS type A sorting domain-containing protein [Bacteroidetes bacterium]|nr:T9SS type A sorting domain-containing protein [Bacteroidota bacterium]
MSFSFAVFGCIGLVNGISCGNHRQFSEEEILIFPNPATNWINLVIQEKNTKKGEISIFDISGRCLQKEHVYFIAPEFHSE